MHRIGDQMSKADVTKTNSSQEESNLEECMQNIQTNLKLIYGEEDTIHLGSYNVNANSGYQSQYFSNKYGDEQNDSSRQHFTSQQSNNDFLLEEKNKQIRNLNKEIAELRKGQQLSQFEQYENYQKLIDNLKKEIGQLQSKVMNKEAVSQINSDRLMEYEEQIKDQQIQIEQQQQLIKELQQQLKDNQEQNRFNNTKLNANKSEYALAKKQINQLTQENQEYQEKLSKQIQENFMIKKVVSDLQNELDQKENDHKESSIVDLMQDVLQTITQFIKEYYNELQKSRANIKYSKDLQQLIEEFIQEEDMTIWQSIDKLSSLVIGVFEQLAFDIKQIEQEQNQVKQMTQQIESLEQMTIYLENTIGQQEQVSKEQFIFYQESSNQNKQEREELMQAIINKQEQSPYYDKIIKNLEELNQAQNNDIKEYKLQIQHLQDQLQLSRRTYQEEAQTNRIQEYKIKKQYKDNLFYKELIQKLTSIISNQDTNKIVDQILELQSKGNEQLGDEIEIRGKLELKEQDLKYEISQNKLSMNEMVERRREVEGLRNLLRNCQKQIEMNKEKIEILIRELDSNMMYEKSKQVSTTYLPIYFGQQQQQQQQQQQSTLIDKLQKTMRNAN